ncbi:MAG: 4Fe-4S binding protein [Synergistaceae bacterium]|jgi:ferredoxin-type protein NapF|nr:4Fe-4S binding protein [Synergistaceae bacterium]
MAEPGRRGRAGYRAAFLVRMFAAAVCLALFSLFFLGMIRAGDPFGDMMNWQFSARAIGVGMTGGAVVLFFAASLIAGRVFCSVFCPMGAIQEFLWRASAGLGAARKKYVKPWKARYLIVALAAAGIIFAVSPLFSLTDPIANFGRGITSFALLAGGENVPVVFASVFLVILIFSCVKGRRFCDWCPAGTIMGFASSVSVFGLKLDEEGCVSCGVCERACPMNCADAGGKKIDRGRCVLCMGCAASCPGSFISFGRVVTASSRDGRRNFIKNVCGIIMGIGYMGGRNARQFMLSNGIIASRAGSSAIVPPGAMDEENFLSRCVGCAACAAACPVGIIRLTGNAHPRLVYGESYCQYNCVECGKVCPTNAIARLDVETKRKTRIALSRLNISLCVVTAKKQACGACAEVCPTHALVMESYDNGLGLTIPSFDEEYCIGCGACLSVCPAEPVAFKVRGVPVQTITPGIRQSQENEDFGVKPMAADDDFPF